MRTHVPDFWEDQKKAEAQKKKVKALHFWIDSYTEIEKSVEELRLAFDFVKEGIVSEEEVDEIYKRTTELIENLELRNMLRREEDKLGVVLKINSGAGGTESQDCTCDGANSITIKPLSPIYWRATRPVSNR